MAIGTVSRIVAVLTIVSCILTAQVAAEVDFNRDIRPILSSNCLTCHGPDEEAREADLRLDTHEGAIESVVDLDSPEDSELLARISSDDPDSIMPPPGHGEPLDSKQQQLLLRWIEQGAKYAKHWSYETIRRPKIPTTKLGPVHNEIDRFVQARMQQVDSMMVPATPADRRTILRRVALDITGLPPTRQEVEAFLKDDSPDAYEKVVDGYLASSAYGERWASMWLDLARYADSAGYADDRKRTIWAYRDYVIRAYNQNMPFDQFTMEQIAGDLMVNPTPEILTGTAFHRNTLTNSEGGTSDEEFRSAAVVDRVNTTMAVWMGTTMACAQCHTHKYDPITQAEYFQFYDFFNQTEDADRPNESPTIPILSKEARDQRAELSEELAALEATLKKPVSDTELNAWISEIRNNDSKEVVAQYVRVSIPKKNAILSIAEVQVFATDQSGVRSNVAVKGKATQSSTGFSGPAKYAIDGDTNGYYQDGSVTHTNQTDNPWWQVDLGSEHPIDQISIWHRTDANLFRRSDGFEISLLDPEKKVVWTRKFTKATKAAQEATIQDVPAELIRLAGIGDAIQPGGRQRLATYYQENVRGQKEIAQLKGKLAAIKPNSTVPIMRELPNNKRRTTKIQIRGNYLDTGDTVTAATPEAFHSLPADADRNRMTLAQWLIDNQNPLTARVVVNRYWEQIFGIGIVATSEEFGSQGELPTHPDLLDWLASDLMLNGWDTRRLVKQIVMSATYRQSSVTTPESLKTDPKNRWLARGPRTRLSAEMIRDQALAVSGLLSRKMYGPPAHPPQPKVGLKPAFSGQTTNWTDSEGEDRYRRAVYTEWRRSAPYPSMATFDMNSREVCEVRRTSTNTPLQALVTLNDPVYVEAAQALARKVVEDSAANLDDKVTKAFELCLIRQPSAPERDKLGQLATDTLNHFRSDMDAARQLATDPRNPPDEDVDVAEQATLTTIANVLLNLDETLMKP